EQLLAFRVLQVDLDALLVPVQVHEVRRVAPVEGRAPGARDVAGARRLHLDDAGAEIGEQRGGQRPGQRVGQIQHGDVVEGKHPVNAAAFAIHSQVHAARPDVVAAAHAHSMYGKSWSSLGRLLDPLTQDSCAFFEDHALFDDYKAVVLDPSEGRRIAKTLGDMKAIILRN